MFSTQERSISRMHIRLEKSWVQGTFKQINNLHRLNERAAKDLNTKPLIYNKLWDEEKHTANHTYGETRYLI